MLVLRPLVKFKFANFKPMNYEITKTKTLASLSLGSMLPSVQVPLRRK